MRIACARVPSFSLMFILQHVAAQMKNEHHTKWDQSIRLFPEAVRLYRKPFDNGSSKKTESSERSPRGKIERFSSHSRLRLRDSLASLTLPDSVVHGVTLTVPWLDLDDMSATVHYKRLFNLFGVSFRRRFPSSACIFRHELQRRRMPHTHMVLFFSAYDSARIPDLKTEITGLWLSALRNVGFFGGSVTSAFRHSVKVQPLEGFPAMFRYISDHASKSKQAQLGYKGKQWGYLNKSLLIPVHAPAVRFPDDYALICFIRSITKLGRFCVPCPISSKPDYFKAFSFKKVPRRKATSIQFVSLSTTLRLSQYYDGVMLDESFDREGDFVPGDIDLTMVDRVSVVKNS